MSLPRYPKYKPSGVEWLGDIPLHWDVMQSRRMFAVRSEPAQEGDRQLTASQKHGVIFQSDFVAMEGRRVVEVIKGVESLLHVEPNDFIISMRSFQGGIEWCRLKGSTSFHYVMLRPVKGVHPPFFAHLFKSATYIQALRTTTDLIRDGQELRYSNFVRVDLPVVPPQEQAAISAFLDREIPKIDMLVAEQERLIELLKEKRQAVISHAVTKGLNRDAPMKDSGIEWVGQCPKHWRVTPLGRLATSRCDGPFGSGLKSEHYAEQGVRVIRLQNIKRGAFDGTDSVFVGVDYYQAELLGHDVVTGDLLVAGLGDDNHPVGRACVAPPGIEPAMVKADCFRFRLNTTMVLADYAAIALSAGAVADAGRLATGSTRSRIPLSSMASRQIVVPPLSEQQSVISYVGQQTSKFDALLDGAQRAIDLLVERRTALIAAAVTGQIDVRPESMRTAS